MVNTSTLELASAQKESFQCVSFSGGGAKGAIYSGAYEALEKADIVSGLEAVAGSSAGAITAALVATGITSDKFKKISGETNLKGLLGGGNIINKDGKPLLELMRKTIRSNIAQYFEDKDMGSYGPDINDIYKRSLAEDGVITFKDIAALQAIAPETFKDLIITATNRSTGDLEIFDSRNTPDVEIALACRASASIPIVFEPVVINGKEYVDGGYRNNIPLSHFEKNTQLQATDITDSEAEITTAKKEKRTLALAFASGMDEAANIAIYSAKEKIVDPNLLVKFLMDVVFKVLARVGGKFLYTEEENKTHEKLRENALNTVVLDTKDVSALSFDLAQEKGEYMHIKGFMQTARHLDNHDIAPITDENFDLKEFMLKVYETVQVKGTAEYWKDQILGNKDDKSKEILEFAKDSVWKNKDKENVVTDAIAVCSKDGLKSKPMKALISSLNDPYTSEAVRKDFVQKLGINISEDKRFDKTKDFSQNLAKFKFEEKDFKSYLQKSQVKGKDTVKDIIANGKSGSLAEKVTSEKEANVLKKNIR